MILAAGRGERLRPLTDHTPKPLIEVGGKPLIAHHLSALAQAGLTDIVVNVAWLGDAIEAALGDGARWGVRIAYSREAPGALDTGGGVRNALPLLGGERFALVNADVFTDFDFARLGTCESRAPAHLVLVDNPPHHREGDFGLRAGRLTERAPRLTYAGIGVYEPELFEGRSAPRFSLAALIHDALAAGRASGEYHAGRWHDVGRRSALDAARAAAIRAR